MANNNKKYVVDNERLMAEWNWDKNNELGLYPDELTCGSGRKAWWVCSKKHEWKVAICNRDRGNNCPYCAGRKAIVGVNDLATTHPELTEQWHTTKNGSLTPSDVKSGSSKKIWWICSKGHEWEAPVYTRTDGHGCPYCANEKQTSFAEQAIYFYCSKFANAINRYIKFGKEIDIYLPEYNIGIEYNGSYWHKNKEQQDREKVKYFADIGIRIITIKEGSKNSIEGNVIEHDYRKINTLNFVIKAIFNLIDIEVEEPDVDRDMNKILEQYIELEKENSVAIKYPKSIREWDYEKNGSLVPQMISYASSRKVWWKCEKCGYEWKSAVMNYSRGHGCSECGKESIAIKLSKPVRCIETNIVYKSMAQAERETGINNITACCKGKRKTAGGYHWEYV